MRIAALVAGSPVTDLQVQAALVAQLAHDLGTRVLQAAHCVNQGKGEELL